MARARSRVYPDNERGGRKRIVSGIETQIAPLTACRQSLIHECVTGRRRMSV